MAQTNVYTRGKPSDHKSQEGMIELDIVETGREGNKAIINYNNPEGWLNYKKLSDKYAQEIRETVRKYKK